MTNVLEIRNLGIDYEVAGAAQRAVREVSLSIEPGESLALVGESGSGKSTVAKAVLGLSADNARILSGSILIDGTDVVSLDARQLTAMRGGVVSLIPQDPAVSLNPLRTVGSQLAETFLLGGERLSADARQAKAIDLLAQVGMTNPELVYRKYPHQISGGMAQRVLIAIAVARRPRLIVADEPTSGLDVTVQRRILDMIDELRRRDGTSLLLVTHDLAVAADRADTVAVMSEGHIVEAGPVARVLSAPKHPYAKALIAAARASLIVHESQGRAASESSGDDAVLRAASLEKEFKSASAPGGVSKVVHGVSFRVRAGETTAIVGESGSGKTTLARMVAGLLSPTSGTLRFVNGSGTSSKAGHTVQFVFQNPYRSLNPRLSVQAIVAEPLAARGRIDAKELHARVVEMIGKVALPASVLTKKPGELSGGQCQRVAIARALIARPSLVVLDEPVSALDVTVQQQILELLEKLQAEFGTAYLFISHDLGVVRRLADHVLVMQHGEIAEEGRPADIFTAPRHAFTRELIASIPGRNAAVAATSA